MLTVDNVSKSYDKTKVLHAVAMTTERGEIHGLIGSNGAGKTTLLKCLAGIYRQDEGKISYDEQAIYDVPEVKQRVAYVADSQEFISIYSVGGLVRLYQNFFPAFSAEKFYRMNDQFQLSTKKIIGNLSKGQKTKLAFMLGIAQNADYLLLDEPESGLDVESQRFFREILIEEVEHRQIGVVISSHNLSGIEKLCDSLTMLEGGKVLWQGNMDTLMGSAQKWQAVWENPSVPARLQNPSIQICGQTGKLTEFYTVGDRETNRKLLMESGAEDLEGRQISLEEIYCLHKEREGGIRI
jgi:ABC-2 type transport system ATP-binding protein